MKLYAFHCRDTDGAEEIRNRLLAEHLAHVEAHIDRYAVAGPLKQGEETVGSLLIVKGESEAEARAVFEADPYFAAGAWQSVDANEFRGVAGDWVGGAAWKR